MNSMRDFLLEQHTVTVLESDLPEIFERIGIKVKNIPELASYYSEHYPKWFKEVTEFLMNKVKQMDMKEDITEDIMFATLLMFRCYALEAALNEVAEALKDQILKDE